MKKIISLLLVFSLLYDCNSQQCKIKGKYGNLTQVYNSDGSLNNSYYIVPGKGDFYGICDAAGNMVVPAQYDMYFTINNGKTIAKSYSKKIADLWDLTKKTKIKLPGISAGDMIGDNGLIAVELSEKKWGYCDINGKVIIPAKFSYAEYFNNGRAFASAGENYGMINEKGQWVIQPKKVAYKRLSANLIFFRDETGGVVKKGLMDNDGEIIIPGGTYEDFEFRDGFVEAVKDETNGALYNYSGKKLTDDDCKVIDYPNQGEAVNGRITVMGPNGFAFLLDTNGTKYIGTSAYRNLTPLMGAANMKYTNLYAADSQPHKWGGEHRGNYKVVKLDGTVAIDGIYSEIIAVNEDLFFAATGYGENKLFSLLKSNGTTLGKDICHELTGFLREYATAGKDGKFGVINIITGETVVPFEYVNILDFDECAITLTHNDGAKVNFDQQLKKINQR